MNFKYARNIMKLILDDIKQTNGYNNDVTAIIEGIRHPDNLKESQKGAVFMWELEEWGDFSTAGNLKYVNFRFRVMTVGGKDEDEFSNLMDDLEKAVYNAVRNSRVNSDGILKAARIVSNRPVTSPEMHGTENYVCESDIILTFIEALRP